MHHDAEISIFQKARYFFSYTILLCCCLFEEVTDSYRALNASIVIVIEAMIPMVAGRRKQKESEERKKNQLRQRASGSAGDSQGKGGGSSGGESNLLTSQSPLRTGKEEDSDADASSVSSARIKPQIKNVAGDASAPTPMKKSFSSHHYNQKSGNSATTLKKLSPTDRTNRSFPGSTGVSPTASSPSLLFTATYIKKAIRAHAGAVPNQMLWLPTGKAPPLWPTPRVVRNILRNHGVTKPKILALDLDETLLTALPYSAKVAAKHAKPTYHEAIPTANGAEIYTVWERPHVQLFLSAMSRLYTVVLFTASVPFYADPFVDRLEAIKPNDYHPSASQSMAARIHKPLRIRRRYYRDSCVLQQPVPPSTPPESEKGSSIGGSFSSNASSTYKWGEDSPIKQRAQTPVDEKKGAKAPLAGLFNTEAASRYAKDLSVLGVPLDSVVLLDNTVESFALFPNNGIHIESYKPPLNKHKSSSASSTSSDPQDDALLSLIPFLEALYYVPDVRGVLSHRIK